MSKNIDEYLANHVRDRNMAGFFPVLGDFTPSGYGISSESGAYPGYDYHQRIYGPRRPEQYARDWDKELPPEKEPKTLKGQFTRFAETTSLMGVPFLNRATRSFAKAFWALIILFAFAYMTYQVYRLCEKYYKRETTSSVKIGFETLDFPSVTICNLNPIRNSSRYQDLLSDDMEDFLELIRPDVEYEREQHERPPRPPPNPDYTRRRKRQTSGDGGGDPRGGGGRQRGPRPGDRLAPAFPETSQDPNYQQGTSTAPKQPGPDYTQGTTYPSRPLDPDYPQGPPRPSDSLGPYPTQDPIDGARQPYPTSGIPQDPFQTPDPQQPPPPRPGPDGRLERKGLRRDLFDPRFQTDEEIFGDFGREEEDFDDFGGGEMSGDLKVGKIFRDLYTSMSRKTRYRAGHQAHMMILDCNFNGLSCSYKNFTKSISADYGNCFTFNDVRNANRSKILKSRRSGADYGLHLTLYLEEFQYLEGLTHGIGARMSIHPYNTMSFVHANGYSLSPGFQTYIGLRMGNISRLGEPYEKCGDNGTFYATYGRNYTHDACLETCIDRTIANICNCFRHEYAEYYTNEQKKNLKPCENSTQDGRCMMKIIRAFERGTLTCGCKQACNATEYQTEYSVNFWPKASLWYSLTNAVCENEELEEDEYGGDACWYFQHFGSDSKQRHKMLEKNFIKVVVYYRDLNFQAVSQQPAYEQEQFLSDFGGTIGLWVGASFITAMEVLDLGAQLICWCCRRKKYKERALSKRKQESMSSTRTRDTSVGSRSTGSTPSPYGRENGLAPRFGLDHNGRRSNWARH